MKKFLVVIFGLALVLSTVGPAKAQNNGLGGLLFGMGSGALVGHAIGGNADGAVVGTFLGGTLGMLIGSEMDRAQSVQTRTVYRQNEYPSRNNWQQQERSWPVEDRYATRECREAEILAEVNGRPKRVYSTVCREDGKWVIQDEESSVERTVVIDRTQYVPQPQFVFMGNYNFGNRNWKRSNPRRHERYARDDRHDRRGSRRH